MLMTLLSRHNLRIFISGTLLLFLCSAAHAKTVVGLAPGNSGLTADQQATTHLARTLGSQLQEKVIVRSFDDPATLYTWLTRFREVDVAILPATALKGLPAGTIMHVLDIHPNRKAAGLFAVVVRPEMPPSQRSRLKTALLAPPSGKALSQLGASAVVPPGTPVPVKKVSIPAQKPARTSQTIAPKPPKPLTTVAQTPSKPVQKQPAEQTQVLPKTSQPVTTKSLPKAQPVKAVQTEAPEQPAPQEPQTITREHTTEASLDPVPVAGAPAAPKTLLLEQPDSQRPSTKGKDPQTVRLYIFLLLLLVAAILVKSILIFRRLQPKKKSKPQPDAPAFERKILPTVVKETEPSPAPGKAEAAPAPTVSNKLQPKEKPTRLTPALHLIERGTLAKVRVPVLLKRCAAEAKPVQLQVTRATGETSFSFANGTITEVAIRKDLNKEDQAGCQQLLYLLSRDEFISPADRDRVVTLVDEKAEPNFVSALLNQQLLKPEVLQNVLEWQAKAAVFSLILFPEGDYRISERPDQILPATPLGQEVSALIPEAAHHRAEWTAIRRALPSLGTRLQFHADGRTKLEQVGLSVQQQLLLSQIDGLQNVGDLCRESVMIDYEIYRFLYMMLKAGVLQQVRTD